MVTLISAQSLGWAQMGYSVSDDNQHFYEIDLSTGTVTDRGPVGTSNELEGLASIGPLVFGVGEYVPDDLRTPSELRLISRPEGLLIGLTGIQFGTEAGAAYNPTDGFIYSVASDDTLAEGEIRTRCYRINPSTGLATEVGAGTTTYLDGLAIDNDGNAYASDLRLTDSIYRLNLQDCTPTLVGPVGFSIDRDSGLAYDLDNGVLYALEEGKADASEAATVYRVDPATGQATPVFDLLGPNGEILSGDFEGFDIPEVSPFFEPVEDETQGSSR
jgi:hypothetical protein